MAFPATSLDVNVEMLIDDTWEDITQYVFDRSQSSISITRGRQNWASAMDPSLANLTLNNIDGRFTPRNPVGPYYGLIGRNTPIRVSVNEGQSFLSLPGDSTSVSSVVDNSQISITGDIDIRIELAPDSTPDTSTTSGQALANKYNPDTESREWALWLFSDGTISFRHSTDGTFANVQDSASTVPIPWGPGRHAIRVTLDVDNGSSGNTTTFYVAPSLDGPWTQLGDPVVNSGTTSIFDGTADVEVGRITGISGLEPLDGRIYKFELRDGIDGSVVANPDFTKQTVGASSFSDDSGNTWSITSPAEISNRNYRFAGEVSSWPQTWDLSGNDVGTAIQASGITRRLGQGQPPKNSALFREFTNPSRTGIVAYWSCEDIEGAALLGSAFPDQPAGSVVGAPEFGSDSSYTASGPLPRIKNGRFSFNVPAYTVTGETSMRVYMAKSDPPAADTRMFSLRCSGTAAYWELVELAGSNPGVTKRLRAKDAGGGEIFHTDHILNFGTDQVVYDLELTESSGNVNWQVVAFDITSGQRESIPTFNFSGTLNSETVGKVINISVAPDGDMPPNTVVGHVVLANAINAYADTAGAMFAWQGESAGDRLSRICKEEGIPYIRHGFSNTSRMGSQTVGTLMDLIRECADADQGLLFEPRDRVGIGYIDRTSLYNQNPQLSLAYNEGGLVGSLDPVDDDSGTLNDVTIQRKSGSTSRATLFTGPLSVNQPPDGVGRYPTQITQNLGYDFQLLDAVGWVLKLGTIDESRYPTLSIDLSYDIFSGDKELTERALLLEQGQRVAVTGLPSWLPPDDISQMVQGTSESLTSFGFRITMNCSPERPYRVAVVDDDDLSHAATDASHITSAVTSTGTSFSVATSSGPVWTTDSSDLPINLLIEGEEVTVTAISGTTSPQTFTVTRSVNGVVKAHSSGVGIRLYQPAIIAL